MKVVLGYLSLWFGAALALMLLTAGVLFAMEKTVEMGDFWGMVFALFLLFMIGGAGQLKKASLYG